MDLTISIVNYNTRELLRQCLSSIYSASAPIKYRVCVVDNSSPDDSGKMVMEHFPSVHLIANGSNVGFGKAHNQVIRATDSEFILLLNPDVIVEPGSIEAMVEFMQSHGDVGILGCKLFNSDMSLQFSCRRYPSAPTIFLRGLYADVIFPGVRAFSHYTMADWDHASLAEVDWLIGSCMLIRRLALEDAGLFDENFFMYYEDVDLCIRMWRRWRVCYFPYVYMVHYHLKQSHKLMNVRQRFIHMRSACHFFRKHGLFPSRQARFQEDPMCQSVA